MRVIALHLGNSLQLEFHPFLTVVQGLDSRQRELVVHALGELTGSAPPRLPGQIEAHGVLLDLDESTLDLLEVRSSPVSAVVRRADLPGSASSPAARTLRARKQLLDELGDRLEHLRRQADLAEQTRLGAAEALDRARRAHAQATSDTASRIVGLDQLTVRIDELGEQRRKLGEALVVARRAVESAKATRSAIDAETADVRQQRRRAVDEATRVATLLDQARAKRDPLANEAVLRARERLADIEREVAAADEVEAARQHEGAAESSADRLATVTARLDELHDLLRVLVPADPTAVREAIALVRGGSPQELVPSPEAFALADELEKVEARLVEIGDGPTADGTRVAAARSRLDEARSALMDAEQAARVPELDRDDVAALDEAHAEVLAALDRADSRFGGARAKRRLDEARDAERAVLERMGFATYADYLMGSSIMNIDPATEAQLDQARAGLADAEDEWRELQLALDADLERGTLLDRRRELRDAARSMLGQVAHISDVPGALRALRVPAVSEHDAEARLRAALDEVGLPVAGEDLGGDDLLHLAETWLVEDERAAKRRDEVVAELDQLAAEREALDARVAAEPPAPLVDRDDLERRLAEARRELAEAERIAAEQHAVDAEVARLEAELAEAAQAEREASAPATAAEARLAEAAAAEGRAVERLAELEADLAAATASEAAAGDELRRLESGQDPEQASWLEADERSHQTGLEEAAGRAHEAHAAVAAAEAERAAVAAEVADLEGQLRSTGGGEAPAADEVEWYLLARLAAQRSVSYAGSVPLVIDDALDGLDDIEVTRLLDRIERMAAAVQIVVVSDAPAVAAWAELAGFERAAVVRPEPVPAPA